MSYRDFHFLGVSRKRRRTWSCHADGRMRSPRRCRVLPRVRPKPSSLPSGGAVLHKVRPYSGCFRGRYYRRYRGRYRGRNQSSVINNQSSIISNQSSVIAFPFLSTTVAPVVVACHSGRSKLFRFNSSYAS